MILGARQVDRLIQTRLHFEQKLAEDSMVTCALAVSTTLKHVPSQQ